MVDEKPMELPTMKLQVYSSPPPQSAQSLLGTFLAILLLGAVTFGAVVFALDYHKTRERVTELMDVQRMWVLPVGEVARQVEGHEERIKKLEKVLQRHGIGDRP